jgi:hypothetical protein
MAPLGGGALRSRLKSNALSASADLNVEHALCAIGWLFEPGDLIEIRALDVGRDNTRRGCTQEGYFNFENDQALGSCNSIGRWECREFSG